MEVERMMSQGKSRAAGLAAKNARQRLTQLVVGEEFGARQCAEAHLCFSFPVESAVPDIAAEVHAVEGDFSSASVAESSAGWSASAAAVTARTRPPR